jgi:hypothetical protein
MKEDWKRIFTAAHDAWVARKIQRTRTREEITMLRLARLAVFLLSAIPASAETLPTYNLESTCRAAPALLEGQSPYQACLKDEEEARAELLRKWSSYRGDDQRSCSGQSGSLPSPSYIALLVCIQVFSVTDTGG